MDNSPWFCGLLQGELALEQSYTVSPDLLPHLPISFWVYMTQVSEGFLVFVYFCLIKIQISKKKKNSNLDIVLTEFDYAQSDSA